MRHKAVCKIPDCKWAEEWDTTDLAGCRATWHIYEDHPNMWKLIFGSLRPPVDPDPRTPEGYAKITGATNAR